VEGERTLLLWRGTLGKKVMERKFFPSRKETTEVAVRPIPAAIDSAGVVSPGKTGKACPISRKLTIAQGWSTRERNLHPYIEKNLKPNVSIGRKRGAGS